MSVGYRRTFEQLACIAPALLFSFLLVGAIPTPVLAQGSPVSHWGVSASFTPTWELMDQVRDVLIDGEGTIEGSEFTVGFVRGSTLGGDWGVSFVRKPFKDGLGSTDIDQQCFNQAQTVCALDTITTQTQGVYLNGIEVHWFIAFVTIKDRVQIGLNVGGGVATVNGTVLETRDGVNPTFGPQGQITLVPFHTEETLLAKDEFLPIFPLGKVEAEGSFIVVPSLKVKIAGGLNFPSISMRIGVVYLFGA